MKMIGIIRMIKNDTVCNIRFCNGLIAAAGGQGETEKVLKSSSSDEKPEENRSKNGNAVIREQNDE